MFSALNSLYAAVSARTREIATLRALGFARATVVGSVMVEAMVLALLGGVLGAMLGWLAFDGVGMASIGATYSQVAFHFAVTARLMLTCVALALLLGMLGGLLPAVRAARLSVVVGLRPV